jgi:hypothetical protein
LGDTFTFNTAAGGTTTATAPVDAPAFTDVRLIVFSTLLGAEPRQPYIRKPFEVMYREMVPFPFSQPLKYAVAMTNSATDSVSVQLPIEANGPVEEIIWVIRRKAQAINNDWFNYSQYTETQISGNPDLIPLEPLIEATININAKQFVRQLGSWFRAQMARRHGGGVNPYNAYVYGFSFASSPGAFQPSGTANLSRAQAVRLDLTVRVPPAVAVPSGYASVFNKAWFERLGGFVPLPFAYCMEEVDIGLRIHAAKGCMIHIPEVRIQHDMIIRPVEKAFQAQVLGNIALFFFLRYPLVLWPLAALKLLRRLLWLALRCPKALPAGLAHIPSHLWRYRHHRRPVNAGRIVSWLLLQRRPIPVTTKDTH